MDRYQQLLAQFLPNATLQNIQPLGRGHIHQTFLVETIVAAVYVLQRINTNIFKHPNALMKNLAAVSDYLKNREDYEMEVLYPIPTAEGNTYYIDEQQQYWRLFPYFSDGISLSKIAHPQQAYEAAYAYGHFAKTLRAFPIAQLQETIHGFHDSLKRYQHFLEVLRIAPTYRKTNATILIESLQNNIGIFYKVEALDLPPSLVHNDTKIDNVLLHKSTGKGLCVIDLDTLMSGTILSDFGDMVRTFCNSEAEDSPDYERISIKETIFVALHKGYLNALEAVITPVEVANLLLGAKWMILEQSMRFLSDYLEEDRYYPVHYPTHNLVRATNQMRLFEALLDQEAALIKLVS